MVKGDGFLLGGGHILQYYRAAMYLLLPDNHGVTGTEGICLPQLGFKALRTGGFYNPNASPPERGCQLYSLTPGFITGMGDKDLRSG